jgi:transposase-like protein
MVQKHHSRLLDERGMHLQSVRGASQMRGDCPHCGAKDKPLHRITQQQYWCATCKRKALKKGQI